MRAWWGSCPIRERNRGILRQPEVVRGLVAAGCLIQITADSLTGFFGFRVQRLARWLILEGLAHCVGTDAHGLRARLPVLHPAFGRVVALVGRSAALELFSGNPARVVSGRSVAACPRPAKRFAWVGWLRSRGWGLGVRDWGLGGGMKMKVRSEK